METSIPFRAVSRESANIYVEVVLECKEIIVLELETANKRLLMKKTVKIIFFSIQCYKKYESPLKNIKLYPILEKPRRFEKCQNNIIFLMQN